MSDRMGRRGFLRTGAGGAAALATAGAGAARTGRAAQADNGTDGNGTAGNGSGTGPGGGHGGSGGSSGVPPVLLALGAFIALGLLSPIAFAILLYATGGGRGRERE